VILNELYDAYLSLSHALRFIAYLIWFVVVAAAAVATDAVDVVAVYVAYFRRLLFTSNWLAT